MAKNKTICLEDNIHELLGKVENASALINKLLEEHFKYDSSDLSLAEIELSKDMEKVQTKMQELEQKRKGIMAKQEEKKVKEILMTEQEKKKLEKDISKKKILLDTFKEEMNRDMTDEEYISYNNSGKNIWNFCKILKELENGQSTN